MANAIATVKLAGFTSAGTPSGTGLQSSVNINYMEDGTYRFVDTNGNLQTIAYTAGLAQLFKMITGVLLPTPVFSDGLKY